MILTLTANGLAHSTKESSIRCDQDAKGPDKQTLRTINVCFNYFPSVRTYLLVPKRTVSPKEQSLCDGPL